MTVEASELGVCLEDGHLDSPVKVSLDVDRRGDDIYIRGTAGVRAVLGCSRCLKEYSLEIEAPLRVWCIMGGGQDDDAEEDREDVIRVSAAAKFVDLADAVRSELMVLLPLRPLCDEACKGFCPRCGIDLNTSSCSCGSEDHDSRWDALDNLK